MRSTWPAIAGFEDGGSGPQVKDHEKSAEAEKDQETELPLASPEEDSPTDLLDFVQ